MTIQRAAKSDSEMGHAAKRDEWTPPTVEALQALLPQYEIITALESGELGAVYKAVQKSLHRTVAITLLPPGLAEDSEKFRERFRNEARALMKLSHPGIVSVYD